jgi:hypothetical protein
MEIIRVRRQEPEENREQQSGGRIQNLIND